MYTPPGRDVVAAQRPSRSRVYTSPGRAVVVAQRRSRSDYIRLTVEL